MSDTPLFDLAEGEERRDEGCAAALIASQHWKRRATAALLSLPLGTNFSSDSLRKLLGDDEPGHPNAWGACLGGFMRSGNSAVCGFKQSTRPEAHARRILVYRRIEKKESPPPTCT